MGREFELEKIVRGGSGGGRGGADEAARAVAGGGEAIAGDAGTNSECAIAGGGD